MNIFVLFSVLSLVCLVYRKIIHHFTAKTTDMLFGNTVKQPFNEYPLFNAVS